jgi:predicted P-loop ATPase/GTPase
MANDNIKCWSAKILDDLKELNNLNNLNRSNDLENVVNNFADLELKLNKLQEILNKLESTINSTNVYHLENGELKTYDSNGNVMETYVLKDSTNQSNNAAKANSFKKYNIAWESSANKNTKSYVIPNYLIATVTYFAVFGLYTFVGDVRNYFKK